LEDLINRNRKIIPGIFTILNLLCGFLAIIKFAEANFISGCWFIIFASVFDALDGQLARFTHSSSTFGVEFDSLADMVSFGVAPSVLLYTIHYNILGVLGLLISFSPLVFGSIRLARFNANFAGKKHTKYYGLPIPLSALTISSFVMFNYNFWDELYLIRLLGPQIVIVCLLMISTIKYHRILKISFKDGKIHTISVIIMLLSFLLIILFPLTTLYPLCLVYILIGAINFFVTSTKSKSDKHS